MGWACSLCSRSHIRLALYETLDAVNVIVVEDACAMKSRTAHSAARDQQKQIGAERAGIIITRPFCSRPLLLF
jgi:hypothetical protein